MTTAIKSITYDSHDVRLLFLINSPESETASVIFIRRWQLFSIKKLILRMCKRFESDAVIADQRKYSRLCTNSLHWGLISHCVDWIELQGLITSETRQVHYPDTHPLLFFQLFPSLLPLKYWQFRGHRFFPLPWLFSVQHTVRGTTHEL